MNRLEVVKEFRFEAAHILPSHPGKCSKFHGHSWVLRIGVTGPVNNDTGFVIDFLDLKGLVQPLIDRWDHSYLGCAELSDTSTGKPTMIPKTFMGYPSSENVVLYVVSYLQPRIDTLPGQVGGDAMARVELSLVELEETCTSRCTWRARG